jgi:hypothetical protein
MYWKALVSKWENISARDAAGWLEMKGYWVSYSDIWPVLLNWCWIRILYRVTGIRLVCKTYPWSDASTIRQKLYLFITHLHLLLHTVTLDIEALVPWHQFTYSLFVPDGCLAIRPLHDSMLHHAFHWDTFGHPPYSLDLAPLDFYLFSKMKEHLATSPRDWWHYCPKT